MEQYIQISKLNDFIFCPQSIYFHAVYDDFDKKMYHRTPQVVGTIKHERIDRGEYSTAKKYLQGMEVFSDQYGLVGKIDIFDQEAGELIERKYKVSKIYDGYKYQLYAQYFCLLEMGYEVKKLLIHSLADNKRYEIALPTGDELDRFEALIRDINSYSINGKQSDRNLGKCKQCIYSELCL